MKKKIGIIGHKDIGKTTLNNLIDNLEKINIEAELIPEIKKEVNNLFLIKERTLINCIQKGGRELRREKRKNKRKNK